MYATTATTTDPHAQLRSLYRSLLERQERFDEFKQLLALYAPADQTDEESVAAADVRRQLNARIRSWVDGDFDDLSVAQVLQWRAIVVDERLNIAVAPWKESNAY